MFPTKAKKTKETEQTKNFIIQKGEAAPILMSTLKSKANQSSNENYVPYCTDEALEQFLTACFIAKCHEKKNVTIDIVGGGSLYTSNVTAKVDSQLTLSIVPHSERARFNQGEPLHPDATAGLQTDIQWLDDHKDNIINAARAALGNEFNNWNIEITEPVIHRNTTNDRVEISVTNESEIIHKSKDSHAPTLKIHFHTWAKKPGLTPAEKSKRLAKAITYYDVGRRNFQKAHNKDSVKTDKSSDFNKSIWDDSETYNLNIFTLPAFKTEADTSNPYRTIETDKPKKNNDFEFLCLTNGIDYSQFQKDLIAAKEQIDPEKAKIVFENATMAAFSHFSTHGNGPVARGLTRHREKLAKNNNTDKSKTPQKSIEQQQEELKEKQTVYVNELFLANVEVILTEAAFLGNELYPKDANDPVLQNIQKTGTAMGNSIAFKTEYKVSETDSSSSYNSPLHRNDSDSHSINTSSLSSSLDSTDSMLSSTSSSSDKNHSQMPFSKSISSEKNKERRNSDAAALVKSFTSHINDAIAQICSPSGKYNVILLLDMLSNINEWYVRTLSAIFEDDIDDNTQKTYESLDQEFWTNIKSISSTISKQLAIKEPKGTLQKERIDFIYSTANLYLSHGLLGNPAVSVKSTFSSQETLRAWFTHVKKINKFQSESNVSATTATQPERKQQEEYGLSIAKAHQAFSYLTVTKTGKEETEITKAKGYKSLWELQRATSDLASSIVGSSSPFAANNVIEPNFDPPATTVMKNNQ